MKKIYITFTAIIAVVLAQLIFTLCNDGSPAISSSGGPGAGYTGSPGEFSGRTCTTCHSGAATPQIGWITSNIPGTGYIPNTTYSITATIPTQTGKTKFGFQVSPQNTSGTKRGTLISTSTQTQLISSGKYIEHTSTGTTGTGNSKSWSFKWTAPAAGTGNVTFYGAFNVTNSDNLSSGDIIYTSQLAVTENLTAGIDFYSSLSKKKMNIFPNPCNGTFTLQSDLLQDNNAQIKVVDITGREVEFNQLYFKENQLFIDLNSVSNGWYIVEIISENKISTAKINVMQ